MKPIIEQKINLNELYHYGMPRRSGRYPYGSGKNPSGPIKKTPEELMDFMKKTISYDSTPQNNILKSPDETLKLKRGICHDQTMLEMDQLTKMGKDPKALFMIETNDGGEGGKTHSMVYYQEGKITNWIENAWGSQNGIRKYKDVSEMKQDIVDRWKKEGTSYSNLIMADFGKHKAGETLNEFVDLVFKQSNYEDEYKLR